MGKIVVDDSRLSTAVGRSEIIGGAFDARIGRIVPVTITQVFRNDGEGYTLYEYRNDKGEALAMLAEVDEGGRTRCWQLTPTAGQAGYAETEVVYDGRGALHHWHCEAHTSVSPSEDNQQPSLTVGPGQSFMFVAEGSRVDDSQARHVGLRVLSFCARPFDLSYETIVGPPNGA